MNRDLNRRLIRLESGTRECEPEALLTDRPMTDAEYFDCMTNWRARIASGHASMLGSVLCVSDPHVMTTEEWVASCRADGLPATMELLH